MFRTSMNRIFGISVVVAAAFSVLASTASAYEVTAYPGYEDPRAVTVTADGRNVFVAQTNFNPLDNTYYLGTGPSADCGNFENWAVPLGFTRAYALASDPTGSVLWVAGPSELLSVEPSTCSVTGTPIAIPAADTPVKKLASNPSGTTLYLTNPVCIGCGAPDTVSIIDVASRTLTENVPVPNGGAETDLRGIAVSPDGTEAYVTGSSDNVNPSTGTVWSLDTATSTFTQVAGGLSLPGGVAFSPDGDLAYVADFTGELQVYDTATDTLETTVSSTGAASDVAVSPDGRFVYVLNSFGSSISVIEVEDGPGGPEFAVADSIPIPTSANLRFALTPSGNGAWVTTATSDIVYGVRLAPAAPTGLSADPTDIDAEITFTPGSDNGSPVTDYEYSVDGGPWTPSGDASSPVTVTGLDPSTEYSVRLRAINGQSPGDPSDPVAFTTDEQFVAPINTGPPTISGTAKVGEALAADPGVWSATPAPEFTFQWERCESGALPAPVFELQWGGFGSGDGQLRGPIGAAIDPSGDVYVADTFNNRIQKFGPEGEFLLRWGTEGAGDGELYLPYGLALDPSGNVYVADSGNNRIQKFASDGTYLDQWGIGGAGDGQFVDPRGIAVDSSGDVYVADTFNDRIQKFDSDGTFLTKWGTAGTGDLQFDSPFGIAVDSSDKVYVADTFNDRVMKFDADGQFLGKWGSTGSGDDQLIIPYGLTTDASGNVYVADTGNARIQQFTPGGDFVSGWGSLGSGEGQFNSPAGVAVHPGGEIYVVDAGNNLIQLFDQFGCTEIEGADAETYTAGPEDYDKVLRVEVTASNGVEPDASAYSSPTDPVAGRAPVNTVPPTISGTAQVGKTLTADPGSWTAVPAPDFTYQWKSCDASGSACEDLAGSDGQTYLVAAADTGRRITVSVNASNPAGDGEASGQPTASVLPAPRARLSRPVIKGPAKVRRGKPVTYRIRVRNTGNAAAGSVRVSIRGRGVNLNAPVGRIAAGKSRTVRVRVRFRKTGRVKARATVRARGIPATSAVKRVRVNR